MNLERYYDGHNKSYDIALKEIKNGKKVSHWMWYIFPQIIGLGESDISIFYSIKDLNEAIDYYNDPILNSHLNEICTELLKIDDKVENIFGFPDYLKLHSCITLFHIVDENNKIFIDLLEKFFNNRLDINTINILGKTDKEIIKKYKKQ